MKTGFAFLMTLLTLSSLLRAETTVQQIDRLLALPHRPTISEFKNILSPIPAQNPFPTRYNMNWKTIQKNVAKAIAEIESVYPGAIILPLGRDVADLGDVIDAFYQAHGEVDRVRRFNASTTTIRNADKDDIIAYVRTLGFSYENMKDAPPFIVLDGSSGTPTSQMIMIRTAVYEGFLELGGRLRDIVDKFNIINKSPYQGTPIQQPTHQLGNRRTYLDDTFYALSTFPNISGFRMWHDSFGKFFIKNGRIDTEGNPYLPHVQKLNRTEVLSVMYEAVKIAEDPKMLRYVRREAKMLGFKFPLGAKCRTALEDK